MTYLLPLFPLGTVLFPGMVLRLHIFEERYRAMFACRADKDPIFGVVLTRSGREVADEPEVHTIGTAASLLKAVRYPDGRYDLAVRGGRRFRVLDGDWDAGYLTASIEWLEEGDPSDRSADDVTRLSGQVRRAFGDYLDALERTADIRIERADLGQQPRELGYAVCAMMPFDTAQRQRLLVAPSPIDLLEDLLAALRRERELLLATGIGGATIDHPGSRFSIN